MDRLASHFACFSFNSIKHNYLSDLKILPQLILAVLFVMSHLSGCAFRDSSLVINKSNNTYFLLHSNDTEFIKFSKSAIVNYCNLNKLTNHSIFLLNKHVFNFSNGKYHNVSIEKMGSLRKVCIIDSAYYIVNGKPHYLFSADVRSNTVAYNRISKVARKYLDNFSSTHIDKFSKDKEFETLSQHIHRELLKHNCNRMLYIPYSMIVKLLKHDKYSRYINSENMTTALFISNMYTKDDKNVLKSYFHNSVIISTDDKSINGIYKKIEMLSIKDKFLLEFELDKNKGTVVMSIIR